MSVARTTVRVTGDVTVSQRSFVGRSGDPVGWLDVGERDELGVYGTPGALRRLAAALLIAADCGRRADRRRRARSAGEGRGVMAIDDLLDRARDARRRRDEAAAELVALVRALDGLAGVGMLDATQRRELTRLRERPSHTRSRHAAKTRTPAAGA